MVVEPDDVKIRVCYATVGHEEMRVRSSGNRYSKEGIIGLEMSGVIVDLGRQAQIQGFTVGDVVTGHPLQYCQACRACRSGRENCCSNLTINTGTMCEFMVWKSNQLVKVSPKLSMREASLIPSVAEALEAIERGKVGILSRVAIWGGNYMSLILCQLIQKLGVRETAVIDDVPQREPMERRMGASHVLHPQDPDFELKLHRLTEFAGFDTIFECSGLSGTLNQSIEYLSRGGTVVLMTCYEKPVAMSMDASVFYLGNYTVTSVLNFARKMDAAEQAARSLRLQELISQEYPLESAPEAFQRYDVKQHYKIAIRIGQA